MQKVLYPEIIALLSLEKISSDDDMVHEALDRVARGWEVCIALLAECVIAMIEDVQIRFKYIPDVDFIDPCRGY